MKQELLKLVREGRALLPHATPEQKVKLLHLIKENLRASIEEEQQLIAEAEDKPQDYLDEK